VAVAAIFNLGFVLLVHSPEPQWIGVGASVGFLIAFLLLFAMVWMNRRRWLELAGNSRPALETV
jgi:ABC-type Fe3+-siderophore transport system permease subunit